jgi:hypothetical protein
MIPMLVSDVLRSMNLVLRVEAAAHRRGAIAHNTMIVAGPLLLMS